ncbi:MAG: ornithine cyclodeaminase [Parvularcula sp.]|nr:ornithine cyclodeaminase [Parvularcula sp.]
MTVLIFNEAEVRRHLTPIECIEAMRQAMIALSRGQTQQLPREIMTMSGGRMLGIMPGAMNADADFGAKIISVFPQNFAEGRPSHQGAVMIFDAETGALKILAHAGEITAIRTGATSAAATDALARKDASQLAILGYGHQAFSHARAISKIRNLSKITIWGRDKERRTAAAANLEKELGVSCEPKASAGEAVKDADIICTVTGAKDPILFGSDAPDGAHINVVGSSFNGPAEVDSDLVVKSVYFADHRPSVIAQGTEYIRAHNAGLIDETHIAAEIGEVFDGKHTGRRSDGEITLYKSLGHIVQDLAGAILLAHKAAENSIGLTVDF